MTQNKIDFSDFQHQAAIDIKRAEKLCAEEDYGFAVFSAQQALEKYLKAYLLKHEIITDPQKLGHLPYVGILELLAEEIRLLGQPEHELVTPSCEIASNFFIRAKSMIEEVFKTEQKRNLVWKQTLGIEITQHEKNILTGLFTEMKNNTLSIKGKYQNVLSSKLFEKYLETAEEARKKLAFDMVSLLTKHYSKDSLNIPDFLNDMSITLRPYLYGSGNELASKELTDFIIKYMRIFATFDWIDIMLAASLHEQTSRYPTLIDGQISTTIYKEHKENTIELIQKIKNSCNLINSLLWP